MRYKGYSKQSQLVTSGSEPREITYSCAINGPLSPLVSPSYERLLAYLLRFTAQLSVSLIALLAFLLAFRSDALAQAKPSGTLLNVSALKSDDQMVCATYATKKNPLAFLSRIDGRPALSKNFWSMRTVQKQLLIMSSKVKRATTKAAVSKLKKSMRDLKIYKSELKKCAAQVKQENASSGITFSHVKGVLDTRCMSCHVSRNVTNTEEWYRGAGYIVPGDTEASPLYVSLKNNPENFQPGNMPDGGQPLTDIQIMALNRWIRDLTSAGSTPPPNPPPPGASDLEQGQFLYATKCAQCHGALESSSKRGSTEQQILAALGSSGVLVMQNLSLSSDEIRKIALALNSLPTPNSRFEAAFNVLNRHCFGCHTGGSYNWDTYTTEQQWVAAGLVTPRDMRASRLTLRIKYGAQDNPIGAEDMPSPKLSGIWNNFSSQDYQIVRDWILNMDTNQPPPDPDVEETDGIIYRGSTDAIRLGDRLFIQSVLLDIFGSSANTIVDDLVAERLGIFGGPCDTRDIYQTYQLDNEDRLRATNHINDCENVDVEDPRASLQPPSSGLRAGLIEKACLSLSFKSSTLQYAVTAAGGAGATSRWPTANDVEKVYQSFYPGRVPPTAVRDGFLNVVSGAQTRFPSAPIEGWRYLFIANCNGGEWQQP